MNQRTLVLNRATGYGPHVRIKGKGTVTLVTNSGVSNVVLTARDNEVGYPTKQLAFRSRHLAA